jgi:DNA-binding NtrC family response regulator
MRTILLVEDDPLQASLRMSILGNRFSHVRRVTDAAEALCLIEQPVFSDNLGLVISGHHSRGLGGPAFVAELRSRKPALPILVLGDTRESATDYVGEEVRFLAKPVAAKEMLGAAAHMLSDRTIVPHIKRSDSEKPEG